MIFDKVIDLRAQSLPDRQNRHLRCLINMAVFAFNQDSTAYTYISDSAFYKITRSLNLQRQFLVTNQILLVMYSTQRNGWMISGIVGHCIHLFKIIK